MVYGYARVSSRDQNEDRQMRALALFPVPQKQIYLDKLSGKNFDRPQYQRLLKRARAGDLIVIKSIDRLGRDYAEILNQWRVITKEKRVDIVILDMPLLDTRSRERDLTGTFIADLVLQILSYVAETERAAIRQRQREGIDAARKRGVRFGAPEKIAPSDIDRYRDAWLCGELSARRGARMLSVSAGTFVRWCQKNE